MARAVSSQARLGSAVASATPRVFSPAWFARHQRSLLTLANHPLTRDAFRYRIGLRRGDLGYELPIAHLTPGSYAVVRGIEERTGRLQITRDCRHPTTFARTLYQGFRPIWWGMHGWDWAIGDRLLASRMGHRLPDLSFGFATLTANPDTGNPGAVSVDGNIVITGQNVSWATLIAVSNGDTVGGSTATIPVWRFAASATTDQYERLGRSIFHFDTSSIGDSDTIDDATLSLFAATGHADTFSTPAAGTTNIYASTVASNTTLATTDIDQVGSTALCDTAFTYAAWIVLAYHDFLFNASGEATINKTGVSKYAGRNANYDVAAVAPTWSSLGNNQVNCSTADNGSDQPKLVVNYTVAGGASAIRSASRSLLGVGR